MTDTPQPDPLAQRARATPDRTALVDTDTDRSGSYAALDQAVDGLAAVLKARGVAPGDRVGLLAPTGADFVRAVHAIFRVGGVVVPLDPAGTDARTRLDRTDAVACCHHPATTATAEALADRPSGLVTIATDAAKEGDITPAWDPTTEAAILFTSGTTGTAKGVRLTGRNLRASAEASAYRLGVAPTDRWLDCLPAHHMGGFAPIVRTVVYGTTLYTQRAFAVDTTAAYLDTHDITGISVVPTMLKRLLAADWTPPATLETVLVGGAPATPDLLETARERGVPVYPTYGMTEAASQIATATPTDVDTQPDTVGQPLIAVDITVVADGEPAAPGEVGELVVDGPAVSPGYLDPERTAVTHGTYGLRTGDRGYRDTDGYLWVTGRVDDLIVSGGVNVDPTAVADTLAAHPDVATAAVVGVADETWGERVCAAVVPAGELDEETLRTHAHEHLAPPERPKDYTMYETLPRTASGTVDRAALRERFA